MRVQIISNIPRKHKMAPLKVEMAIRASVTTWTTRWRAEHLVLSYIHVEGGNLYYVLPKVDCKRTSCELHIIHGRRDTYRKSPRRHFQACHGEAFRESLRLLLSTPSASPPTDLCPQPRSTASRCICSVISAMSPDEPLNPCS